MKNKIDMFMQIIEKVLKKIIKIIIVVPVILSLLYPILFLSPITPYLNDVATIAYNKYNSLLEKKSDDFKYGDIKLESEQENKEETTIITDNDNVKDLNSNNSIAEQPNDYNELKNRYLEAQYRRDTDLLNDDQKELLEHIIFEITKFRDRVEIPSGYKISTEELAKIISIIRMDYPELFMLDLNYSYETIGDRVVAYLPTYKINQSEYNDMFKKLNLEVFNIVEKVENLSPYEQLLFVHNYLLQNSTYTSKTLNNNNMCGIILDGEGACEGYSSSFMYITNILGFKTSQVFGEEVENKSDLAHSWNLVEYNDQAYYFDLTWDFSNGKVHQTYFGMTYEEMIQKHDISLHTKYLKELPTKSNDGAFSYHKQMNLIANSLEDFEEIIYSRLKDNRMIQVKFANNELYHQGIKNIDKIMENVVVRLDKDYTKYSILYYEENNTLILFDFIKK